MSEAATHVASGKVREIYALDEERLLLVASDRISTFDVVLPTDIPDKGRVLTGLSAFWFARTSELVPNHLLQLRADGALDGVPAARHAPDRVRRARLPHRLGLEGLPRDAARSAGTGCRKGSSSRSSCPSRSSRRRRRRTPATTRTSRASRLPSWSAPTSSPRRSASRWRSTATARTGPRRAGSSSPTRSSSSASTRRARSCSATRP